MNERKACIIRASDQAEVKVVLNLDGKGDSAVQTGIPFLDHMLALFARHGAFDLEVQCKATEAAPRLLAEDVAACLGLALDKALGDKTGICRAGHSLTPVDEHLARAVVEISGRPCLVYRVRAAVPSPASADSVAVEGFWRAFAAQARLTIHIELLYGDAGLPAFEAVFKAAARALSDACWIRARLQGFSPRAGAD
jgi:imidazoleglycerol-phosphate dehydratase